MDESASQRAQAVVDEALLRSRSGDLPGALALLQEAHSKDDLPEAGVSLLFMLLRTASLRAGLEDPDHTAELLALCQTALDRADNPLGQSTWLLRRGLLLLAQKDRDGAAKDLTAVLKLRATDDHQAQAKRALLEVAKLASKKKR